MTLVTPTDTFKATVEPFMTLENALDYERQMDRWVWVIDSILDPAQVRITQSRILWVEDRFDAMLMHHEKGIVAQLTRDAAQDLLEALIEIEQWAEMDSDITQYPAGTREVVRTAILKAQGY